MLHLVLLCLLFTNTVGQIYFRSTLDFINATDEDFSHWREFTVFQEKFGKHYRSIDELESRFSIFRKNLIEIVNHNRDVTQNFTMGVNQFTDLTPQEFKAEFVGAAPIRLGAYGCKSFSSSASSAPAALDWRTKGAVTSVKDQGQCGSCWTFSATGAIEGAWAIAKGQLVDLSEQELVDCATGLAYGSHGCSGGQMDGAFKYAIENGQCSNAVYSYTAKDGVCQKCSAVAHISSCSDVKSNDQVSLKGAVAQQPVAIAIEADTRYFQSYSSGILTSSSCGTNLDHGVLIVGYGQDNGQDYWLVKNSWGTTWGDKGYVKIARSSSTNDAGVCGIAMMPSFPSV
jgi:KDEL-tailed cysteine endopeptidase